MIALSADIKFACSHCGQRMVVEKSGAGLVTNCPGCENEMIVPHASIPRGGGARASWESYGESEAEMDAELFAGAGEGTLETAYETAQQEIERLRSQLKKALEEGERVKSSAMHAQAEIKSFHADRQHLKNELSQARQRILAVEAQAVALAAALEATEEEREELRAQYDNDFAVSRERLAATETQLEVRERELSTAQAINTGLSDSLAAVETELATLQAEKAGLLQELSTAQQLLNEAAEIEVRSEHARQELEAQLNAAAAENQRLSEAHDQLSAKAETLRRDLLQTDSGCELIELRNRVEALTTEQSRLGARLAEKTAEVEALTAKEQALTAELEGTRRRQIEAEQLAAANSEAKLKKDNDVLRGIIARQNVDLGVHHVEVRRLRRARFALRILYTVFAIGLLGVISLAFSIFANQNILEMFEQIFR